MCYARNYSARVLIAVLFFNCVKIQNLTQRSVHRIGGDWNLSHSIFLSFCLSLARLPVHFYRGLCVESVLPNKNSTRQRALDVFDKCFFIVTKQNNNDHIIIVYCSSYIVEYTYMPQHSYSYVSIIG